MIVCSCQGITDRDINAAINWMRDADAQTIITPGRIFHALGKSPDCGGCIPLFVETMRENDNLHVPRELRNLRGGKVKEKDYEGQRQGHRVP